MRFNDCFKLPRLYLNCDIQTETLLALSADQLHYLKNVLRGQSGDKVRIFNGRSGEWLASIESLGKKDGLLKAFEQFKPQPANEQPLHLLFAPIKKKNMDFMIEKAVELGVTDLHPVMTARTQNAKINDQRMHAQIIEATEQCERLCPPVLHESGKLDQKMRNWPSETPLYWAAERLENAQNLGDCTNVKGFLIGPEGGFNDTENTLLKGLNFIHPINLGEQILRTETAALHCLSHAKLSRA